MDFCWKHLGAHLKNCEGLAVFRLLSAKASRFISSKTQWVCSLYSVPARLHIYVDTWLRSCCWRVMKISEKEKSKPARTKTHRVLHQTQTFLSLCFSFSTFSFVMLHSQSHKELKVRLSYEGDAIWRIDLCKGNSRLLQGWGTVYLTSADCSLCLLKCLLSLSRGRAL